MIPLLATTAPANVTKAAAAVGVDITAARSDHKHDISTAAAVTVSTSGANAEGAGTTLARAAHTHKVDVSSQQVSRPGSSSVTNTGTAYTQLDAGFPFELALPAAGTYLLTFSATFYNNTNSGLSIFRLQSGANFGASVAVGDAQAQERKSSNNNESNTTLTTLLVAGGATNLYVGVAQGAVGQQTTTFDRVLTAVRLA